nr:MAG TPA: hypothetical protein [Caudoviricetes sp.]
MRLLLTLRWGYSKLEMLVSVSISHKKLYHIF